MMCIGGVWWGELVVVLRGRYRNKEEEKKQILTVKIGQ
jgi:hypothetical protein